MFHVFLKQFLIVFKNWEPVKYGQLPEAASTAIQPGENSTSGNDIVGCFAGHPSEIILTLTEEIMQITTLVSESKLMFIFSGSCFHLGRLFVGRKDLLLSHL